MILMLGAVFMADFARAQVRTPQVVRRQYRQQQRIRQGLRDGSLTLREARQLEMLERKLRQDKRIAKSDGIVTYSERIRLNREEDNISRAIYRKRHNYITQ